MTSATSASNALPPRQPSPQPVSDWSSWRKRKGELKIRAPLMARSRARYAEPGFRHPPHHRLSKSRATSRPSWSSPKASVRLPGPGK
ncbi:MAG: hypothetical protein CM15mP77_2840 [Synechococcus sp.]|nr:MAG: hypothetical protein CM15mP77_2840 [Synechococcus sp.]